MSETITVSREVRLVRRPADLPTLEDFSLTQVDLAAPAPGEVRVLNNWMSVDPYMRGRMKQRDSYVPPFELDRALEGGAVGTVVQTRYDGLSVGDRVLSMAGWREAFNAPGESLRKVDTRRLSPEAYLGVAGLTGLTAYVGITKVASVVAGDVVFVSAAAGAVGSIACQLAKAAGATVIGSAGGVDKCAYLRSIGIDATIDYRAEDDLALALRRCAPDGIDVYFDNVGGAHLEAALEIAKPFARFALCGMISGYNDGGQPIGNLDAAIRKRIRLEGFIASDHFGGMPAFVAEMTDLIEAGRITWRQTVELGIERAPAAFLKLFSGENIGKMLVKLS